MRCCAVKFLITYNYCINESFIGYWELLVVDSQLCTKRVWVPVKQLPARRPVGVGNSKLRRKPSGPCWASQQHATPKGFQVLVFQKLYFSKSRILFLDPMVTLVPFIFHHVDSLRVYACLWCMFRIYQYLIFLQYQRSISICLLVRCDGFSQRSSPILS